METLQKEITENKNLNELVQNLCKEVECLKERLTHVEKDLIKQKSGQKWV